MYWQTDYLSQIVCLGERWRGGDQREGHGGRIWPKKPKMALISKYLAADVSADALCIINIGYSALFCNFFQQKWPWDWAGHFAYHKPCEINILFGPKIFLDQNFLWLKVFSWPKNFLDPKIGIHQIVWTDRKNFWPNFWVEKSFFTQTQNFFDSNFFDPEFFWPKIFLDPNFFLPEVLLNPKSC